MLSQISGGSLGMVGKPYADSVMWDIGKCVAQVQLERWVDVADKWERGILVFVCVNRQLHREGCRCTLLTPERA